MQMRDRACDNRKEDRRGKDVRKGKGTTKKEIKTVDKAFAGVVRKDASPTRYPAVYDHEI